MSDPVFHKCVSLSLTEVRRLTNINEVVLLQSIHRDFIDYLTCQDKRYGTWQEAWKEYSMLKHNVRYDRKLTKILNGSFNDNNL